MKENVPCTSPTLTRVETDLDRYQHLFNMVDHAESISQARRWASVSSLN